jgi:hypothetical protein
MSTCTCVGIDNGTSGALASVKSDGTVELLSMPVRKVGDASFIDAVEVECWLTRHYCESEVALRVTFEQGQKQPKFGTKGNFANGYSFGVVQTVLDLMAARGLVRFQCVNPRTWQKMLFADLRGLAKGNTKGAAIELCRRRFPATNLVPTRCRNPHDGWADALCLAEYSRLTLPQA